MQNTTQHPKIGNWSVHLISVDKFIGFNGLDKRSWPENVTIADHRTAHMRGSIGGGGRGGGLDLWKITPPSAKQRNAIFRLWADGGPLRMLVWSPSPLCKV